MDIKIDTPQLQELLSQAVYASLDDAKREALIKGAIQHLMTRPNSSGYGQRESPIESAFQSAVREVAQKIANDVLANDEALNLKVRELLNDALVRLTETHREETIRNLAEAIRQGMAYRER